MQKIAILFLQVVFIFFAMPSQRLRANIDDDLYLQSISQLIQTSHENESKILFESRNQRIYLHGIKKKCVVINLHGLYQSPKDQRGIAEYFFNSGCNVISLLLAGHWAKDPRAFNQMNH